MNSENFAAHWKALRRRCFAGALRCTWNEERSEEIVGRVLVATLKALPRLPEDGEDGFRISSWIYFILRNELIRDYHQHKNRRASVPLSVQIGEKRKEVESSGMTEATVRHWQERRERAEVAADCAVAVAAVVAVVRTERERSVLAALMLGDSPSEASRRLGISRQQVSQILQRFRHRAEDATGTAELSGEHLFALGAGPGRYATRRI